MKLVIALAKAIGVVVLVLGFGIIILGLGLLINAFPTATLAGLGLTLVAALTAHYYVED